MGDVSYRPLIEGMRWSYSRISSFEDCKYRWFLTYILKCEQVPQFYSSYGTFMHELIEQYYRGAITKEQMETKFLFDFKQKVIGERPSESIVQKYIKSGIEYLRGFEPFPFEMVDVEKTIEFEIDSIPFIGIIDYIGLKDGEYYIVDNKSRDLKPRSNRKKPTAKDRELDDMLRQLYLYSAAVKQEYGKFPKALCFNCFKSGVFIEEPFNPQTYCNVMKWAVESIHDIENTEDFYPSIDFFRCRYLCGVSDECCYYEGR